MRSWRIAVALALIGGAALCFAVPKALIVQNARDATSSSGPILLGDALAEALEQDGKVDPIVWSETDPVFRAALLDGRIHSSSSSPDAAAIQDASKALGCDYVMLLTVQIKGTSLSGQIDLLKGAQSIWTDSQTMDPGRAGINDLENAVRSVARTWAIRMSTGPLRSLTSQPKPPETPPPAQGQAPDISPVQPQTSAPDPSRALAEYQRLNSSKQVAQATTLLRASIDESPFEPKLRIALIQHLLQIGRAAEAASEAQRALIVLPDNADIRSLAAKTLLDSGQSDRAETELNEALARNPGDVTTRMMLADLALKNLNAKAALDHIEVAWKSAPSKDLAYRRGAADAINGDGQAVQNDLALAGSGPAWVGSESTTYSVCMDALDRGIDQTVNDLRSLVERATVRREDPDVASAIDNQLAVLAARQAFLNGWAPPSVFKSSHGKRLLALNLLAQSLNGIKAFLSDGNEDTLSDANIDLGEAIKQFTSARKALASEQGTEAKDGSTPLYSSH